jgi:hypothetical protein
LGRYLEVEDVGAVLPGLETDGEVHVRHGVLYPCWCCLTILMYHVRQGHCTEVGTFLSRSGRPLG